MSSQRFTPVEIVDMTKERDWAADLGILDWDKTSIVFTKRTLIEFLKYTGTTVDTNNTNISKLPRYAKFGKLEPFASDNTDENVSVSEKPEQLIPDAVPTASTHNANQKQVEETAMENREGKDDRVPIEPPQDIRPSRRVRTAPGGKDSLTDWWDSEPTEEFRPTRRVRQTPGGQDNLAGIL